MSQQPIGIFDSGVGGLTVVKALRAALPAEAIVYFGDTARVPYGTKSADTIRRYAVEDTRFLLRFDPKMIIVACNTASAAALDYVARQVQIPVIGVIEPGAAAAAAVSKTGKIGVVATETTVESRAYERAITNLRPDARVIQKACPLFVPMVEEGRIEGPVAEMLATEYLGGLAPLGVDTLVLGCTHYPVLRKLIRSVMGEDVSVVDSAEETARAVRTLLAEKGIASENHAPAAEFFASDNPSRFHRLATLFLGATPVSVTLVEPEDFFGGAA